MIEDNNRKGPGIFYAVVGVATLVVAIIGATFAYFSANAENNTEIKGNTAQASNLELTITKVTSSAEGLIPMFDKDLGLAIGGTRGKANCVDDNNNTICHVYQIALKNGKSPVQIAGNLSFTSDSQNIVYAVLGTDETATKDAAALATVAGTATTGKGFATPTTLDTSTAYAAEATKYYYVAVWLRDIDDKQEIPDSNKSYTGTVTFNAAGGGGVTATFSG